MKNLFTAGIILLAIQFSSCKKNTSNEINIQDGGQQPITAKVNDKPWAVPALSSALRTGAVNYDYYAGYNDATNAGDTANIFLLGFGAYIADSTNNNSDKLGITIQDFSGNGSYTIKLNDAVFASISGTGSNPTLTTYFAEGQSTDQIIITDYDKANKTISGTFSFMAKNADNEIIKITEGSFNDIPIK